VVSCRKRQTESVKNAPIIHAYLDLRSGCWFSLEVAANWEGGKHPATDLKSPCQRQGSFFTGTPKEPSVSFFSSPEGNIYAVGRIGGAKAVLSGFLLLGAGPDDILEYSEVPTTVAIAWRDAARRVLQAYRPGRQPVQADWKALAAAADPAWAEEHLGVPRQAAPIPGRPVRLASGSGE
jgi:hypothetical protein